jgi:NADPH:quinone reductase-like Zn-dependent oxidoreductase
MGATPIAAIRTGAKREALRRVGAAYVIATQGQDLISEVRAITGGKGVRLIFDPVAGPFVETLAKAAAPGGTIIIYGGLNAQATLFPGGLEMVKGLTMRGCTLFETTRVRARSEGHFLVAVGRNSAFRSAPVLSGITRTTAPTGAI